MPVLGNEDLAWCDFRSSKHDKRGGSRSHRLTSDDDRRFFSKDSSGSLCNEPRTEEKTETALLTRCVGVFGEVEYLDSGLVLRVKLDELWDKYDKVQTELETLDLDAHSNDRDEFETKFFITQVLYDDRLPHNTRSKSEIASSKAENTTNTRGSRVFVRQRSSKKCTMLVVDKITNYLPNKKVDMRNMLIPAGTPLADLYFYEPEEIHLLLGAESENYKTIGGCMIHKYQDFMHEYLELGHMEKLSQSEIENSKSHIHYYLPHHAVLQQSTTTSLRVVFDASAKGSEGKSLNDVLISRPTIQQNLLSVIIRFRTYRAAFSADIQKMFRMILVNSEQTHLQRILWRNNPQETVTYCTSCAPYLATKCLLHLTNVEGDCFPLAALILVRDFYMNDVLSGANDLEEALEIQKQLIELLKLGGFHLRKWCSNRKALLESVKPEDRETSLSLQIDDKSLIKTLRLLWCPTDDIFKFAIIIETENTNNMSCTKRTVLSDISRIFDPLDLLSPIVIRAKLFMEELWKLHVAWDDRLSEEFTIRMGNGHCTSRAIAKVCRLPIEESLPGPVCSDGTTSVAIVQDRS
ncbi:hypothetical protein ILUMI_02458 [Ignelater luminosus]|uniref:Uncharacterized protein n=1 Tax=Ignelater luminosus TaxID=2038154 RepID=A0A8K0GN57_IGNLU|nr:hypothetical protein ILUMI_02458 [Ignelater luminosus]